MTPTPARPLPKPEHSSFPKVLPTGAVVTSAEVEGPSESSDWGRWISDGHAPVAGDGNGFATSGAEDLALLAELGMTEVVLTLEWARLEPQPGELLQPEVERMRSLLHRARELGMSPWACLVDGTLPGWFAVDERGFTEDRTRQLLWPRHVERMGETFGDLVDGWLPLREGIHHAVRNRWLGIGPQGRHDAEAAPKAVKASILANGEAWRVLAGSAPVAICETARLFIPKTDDVKAEGQAQTLDNWYRQAWTHALAEGQLDVHGASSTDVPHMRGAFDRHVLQVRPAARIDGDGRWSPHDDGFLVEGLATAAEQSMKELPEGSTTIAADLAPIEDEHQAAEHLTELRSTAEELGATAWLQTSPIDGWHWERGIDGLGGIMAIDRTRRPAAEVFA